jgi:hypothetical protein
MRAKKSKVSKKKALMNISIGNISSWANIDAPTLSLKSLMEPFFIEWAFLSKNGDIPFLSNVNLPIDGVIWLRDFCNKIIEANTVNKS